MQNRPLKALALYWSATGNTKTVAEIIQARLEKEKVDSKLMKIIEAGDEDLFTYDIVFMGAPAYQFHVSDPVSRFIKAKMQLHSDRHDIKPDAPVVPGEFHNREELSTQGRLGALHGRPNEEDLVKVSRAVSVVVRKIRNDKA